jgi:hypothetical protein
MPHDQELICPRLEENAEITMTKDGFLRMCKTSYTQSQTAKRVPAIVKPCKICEIGRRISDGEEVYPTNVCWAQLSEELTDR